MYGAQEKLKQRLWAHKQKGRDDIKELLSVGHIVPTVH
jgi:hypothetical protein